MADSSNSEYIVLAGTFFGGLLMGMIGYFRKKTESPATDALVTSVGMEFGSRIQMDELIKEVRRIGDILEGKRQAAIEHKLDELLEKMDEPR